MNVLISSAGRRVSLLRSFKKEIQFLGLPSKVFAIDANPHYSSACQVADKYFKVERLNHPAYLNNLLTICEENNISLVIPTIDTELLLYAQNSELFTSLGIDISISDISLIEKCRDKRLTHELFTQLGIDIAASYEKENPVFPLFIKPYDGSCSVDTFKIENQGMLTDYHFSNEKLMFLEYLDQKEHQEFTVDMYYDRTSILKCIVPRERIEVRSGEVNKGITRKNFLTEFLFNRMRIFEGARGCITLQVFVNKKSNRVIGIEVNPRFGGGYPLTYASGANYTQWVLKEYLMSESIEFFDQWEDNLLMLRYDDEILVHDSGS